MSKVIEALEKAKKEGFFGELIIDGTAPRENPAKVRTKSHKFADSKESSGYLRKVNIDPTRLVGVDPHLETLHSPMSFASEQYRTLRKKIERLGKDIKVIAITSAAKGEGKSLTAANLSVVMAQDATKRVVLVDADLRRPTIHKLFNGKKFPGIANYIQGEVPVEDIVRPTAFYGLSMAFAGDVKGHPGELLASPQFVEFMAKCRESYDYAVVDTPPLSPVSDMNFLAEAVDGVLLVVRANKTGKEVVKQAAASIPSDKLIGAMLNRVDAVDMDSWGDEGCYYKYY